MEMRRIPDEQCVSSDERGHGVRLKVNPNVRIPEPCPDFFAIVPTRYVTTV